LTIEFDGTDFHGWQIQKEVRTVQGTLAEAIRKGLGQETVQLNGCSRTDAGVHASGYCANFHTTSDLPLEVIRRILNSRLPEDVSVVGIAPADEDFHARHSAVSKTYRYAILRAADRRPLRRRYTWHVPGEMDLAAIREAALLMEGEHDFTAFSGRLEPAVPTVRRVDAVRVVDSREELHVEVRAPSFLYRMVRIMVGTLVDVGKSRITCDYVAKMLSSGDKRLIRPAAPAQGLTLVKVEY